MSCWRPSRSFVANLRRHSRQWPCTRSKTVRGRPPAVLSIAGSDSGGGAGIQADLRAFARCGVHGMTAITAITAQNTVGVNRVEAISPETIVAQVRAVAEDIGVDAVKIGMLGSAETVEAVVEALELVGEAPIVVDPVMVAESGAILLDDAARTALVELLLPRADVVTPNIPEATALAGADEGNPQEDLAREVLALGPRAVAVAIEVERHPPGASHGSGCTHSSALAAYLAHGLTPVEAARRAREVASAAVAAGLRGIGRGAGPVDALEIATPGPRDRVRRDG